nr:hypothetical protein [Tanacetum cinerariifolium]
MHIETNVLESFLNTLLMNEKFKDTTKARKDLKNLSIRIPYGLQQYLPSSVTTPIIELCSFFKKICAQTLMEADMVKADSQALEGWHILNQWMYPFERYMTKLKNYVRNKAKPKGSIAEGYGAEEALTFSSHYFRDVTTKFNHPDRNVDCPPPTCQFQVFRSICKSIGKWSVIRFDHQELKKVIWYVLHNTPKIDTYQAKFKIEFPNQDMKEEYPDCLNDLDFATLNTDSQSIDVDAPPDIIDDDEDGDLIDDEDVLPHNLADSDDEDLTNGDDDNMSADVAHGHGGDSGGDDRLLQR